MLADRYHAPAAWLLLAVAALLLFLILGLPLVDLYQSHDDRIDRSYRTLAKLRAITEKGVAAGSNVSGEAADDVIADWFFSSVSGESDLVLELRKTVEQVAATYRVSLSSVDNLRATDESGVSLAGVKLAASANVSDLAGFLEALEAHRPLLNIDNISIRGSARRNAGNAADRLSVTLELRGYFIKPGAEL